MKTFRYKGMTTDGAAASGVIKAYDEFEAVTQLRENHTIITKIDEVKEAKGLNRNLGGISEKELALMCSQFSIILNTGLSIVRCVEMVAAQARNKQLRQDLEHVAEDIAGGYSLAQSFEKNMPKLPTTFVETIRAGEQSGTLEDCFQRLYKYFDKSSKMKAKVISAMTYPAIVICVAIVVFIVVMVVAVPTFTDVFADMDIELPGITKALIAISDFFVQDSWILLILAGVLGVGYLLIKRDPQGRRKLSELALNNSPFRRINSMRNSAQFADTMATMLAAGLPITSALEVTAAVVPNFVFGEGVRKVLQSVQQGKGVAASMATVEYFPKMLTEMTGVGENAGSLEETLTVVGDYYNNEVQLASERLLAVLEPAVTVVLAVVTAVLLLLAVYLPLFTLNGAI